MRLLERSTWTDHGVGCVKRCRHEFHDLCSVTVQRRHLDVGRVEHHRGVLNGDTPLSINKLIASDTLNYTDTIIEGIAHDGTLLTRQRAGRKTTHLS